MNRTGLQMIALIALATGTLSTAGIAISAKGPERAGDQSVSAPSSTAGDLPAQILQDDTTTWQMYRSKKSGFRIRYPSTWTIMEESDFVGFRSPEWDKPPKLDGPTVTVCVWKDISMEEALLNSGFETKEQAVRDGDIPLGGFGSERYLVCGSSAGPATPALDTLINGHSAIVAVIPTRLYDAEGYAGASEGKQVLIMGDQVYASIRIESPLYEVFDRMISTFVFEK